MHRTSAYKGRILGCGAAPLRAHGIVVSAQKNDGERGQLDHVSSPDRAPEIIEAGGTARPHLTLATTDYDHVPNLASGAVCAEGILLTAFVLPVEEVFYIFIKNRE